MADQKQTPKTDPNTDRFVAHQIKFIENSCQTCIHRFPNDPGKCIAFPDGIPEEILDGKNDHKKPYPGDHSVQYEPA